MRDIMHDVPHTLTVGHKFGLVYIPYSGAALTPAALTIRIPVVSRCDTVFQATAFHPSGMLPRSTTG